MRGVYAWITRHERFLSAGMMVGGALLDQIFFLSIDHWTTQVAFLSYLAICFVSIVSLHYLESKRVRPRWRVLFLLATQFSFGGFWSGFLVFYGRSAVFAASWPFILLIVGILVANEIWKEYHDRLVFTSVLFFFALYTYAIFEVPVLVGSISTPIFLASGAVALGVFAGYTAVLRMAGSERFGEEVWRIRGGVAAVLITINLFYFTSVLPPLPLTANTADIYHAVNRSGDTYIATTEPRPLYARMLGLTPTITVVPGQTLSAYSAIFAPVRLTTKIMHVWERQDPISGRWIRELVLVFPIAGGRDGGYRGYSIKANPQEGNWRVEVETEDGRLIARIPFKVVIGSTAPTTEQQVLK